jgi:coproporphyrinogen III oxidase
MIQTNTKIFKEQWIEFIHDLQDAICNALEAVDGKAKFIEDKWERGENGGGGKTRVISNGNVFEKGGVNTSVVYGEVTDTMRKQLKINGEQWFAAGLSLVIHPMNPMIPTVHCNYRYFELYEKAEVIDRWFGGGTDLTPYYLFEEDAIHFHQTYKNVCDQFDREFYTEFKKTCDDYFVNTHRDNERRGIGGIFYDHKKPDQKHDASFWMAFAKACGDAFIDGYVPVVEKRKRLPFNEQHKYWQEIRRGRYVEFNLVHDRGTIFGLKTNGRTESILMSLPPTVRFDYNYQVAKGSAEAALQEIFLHPKDWLKESELDKMDADEWARRVNTTC